MSIDFNVREVIQNIKGLPQNKEENGMSECMYDYPDGYIPTMAEAILNMSNARKTTAIEQAMTYCQVAYYREILNNNKGIVFAKRVIRKFLFFLLKPIVEDQNRYNDSVLNILLSQDNEIRALKGQLEEMKIVIQSGRPKP